MLEGIGRRPNRKARFLDIGQHSVSGREPSVLFRNLGDGRFTDVAWANGVDTRSDGRGLAVLDFDRDGRLDLALRNYRQPAELFRNVGPARHWVAFELTGRQSNRDAVGARVRIRTGEAFQTRVVTSGGGYLSASSRRLHFGLGDAASIDETEIVWPSGQRMLLGPLQADRSYTIREDPLLGRR
jgi:hypothetical protein